MLKVPLVRLEGVTLLDLVQRSGAVAPWLYLPPAFVLSLDATASVSDRALRILQRCAAKMVRCPPSHASAATFPPACACGFVDLAPTAWHCQGRVDAAVMPYGGGSLLCRLTGADGLQHQCSIRPTTAPPLICVYTCACGDCSDTVTCRHLNLS